MPVSDARCLKEEPELAAAARMAVCGDFVSYSAVRMIDDIYDTPQSAAERRGVCDIDCRTSTMWFLRSTENWRGWWCCFFEKEKKTSPLTFVF